MSFMCDECAKRFSTEPHLSVTGRRLCPTCWERLTGATAAVMAGGGVAEAIATAGWFSRIRRVRGKGA